MQFSRASRPAPQLVAAAGFAFFAAADTNAYGFVSSKTSAVSYGAQVRLWF